MNAIDDFLYNDGKPHRPSGLLTVSPTFYATYEATREFWDRDWRRIKREVRKAQLKARKQERAVGMNRAPNPFWRQPAQRSA